MMYLLYHLTKKKKKDSQITIKYGHCQCSFSEDFTIKLEKEFPFWIEYVSSCESENGQVQDPRFC